MVDAPVDAEAVLLLLHAPFTLATIELTGQKGRHSVPTLALGIRSQLVGPIAGNALPESPEFGAAARVVGAGLPGLQAVPGRADHIWRRTRGKKRLEVTFPKQHVSSLDIDHRASLGPRLPATGLPSSC